MFLRPVAVHLADTRQDRGMDWTFGYLLELKRGDLSSTYILCADSEWLARISAALSVPCVWAPDWCVGRHAAKHVRLSRGVTPRGTLGTVPPKPLNLGESLNSCHDWLRREGRSGTSALVRHSSATGVRG
jgi:hypothetical protein